MTAARLLACPCSCCTAERALELLRSGRTRRAGADVTVAQPPPPPRDAGLAELARRVRRLGVAGRTDPEQVLVEKDAIAAELGRLARSDRRRTDTCEGGIVAWRAPPAPAPVAARPADERARRAEALARSLVAEVGLLRGLLAAAVRRHLRRRRPGPHQLELPGL